MRHRRLHSSRVAELNPDELSDVPSRPADRMPRRERNRWCILIIAIGALNLVAYTLSYAALGGDAFNGRRQVVTDESGQRRVMYVIRGHHLRTPRGEETQVSRAVWVYSYSHSIALLLTSGAMVISMLVLARPHIIATMRDGWISGESFVVAFGTIVVLLIGGATFLFVWDFVSQLMMG
ncbi:MAG: hypothetical protein JNG88_08190 [Phycisphaerales bacterium]|nr:hypothetical protein [Phycisphaerales bacterium]